MLFESAPNCDLRFQRKWRKLQMYRSKLKASIRISALLCGFGMVAIVEVSVVKSANNPIPTGLLIAFGVVSVLLVFVHLFALMISTCILPNVDKIALSEERDVDAIDDSPHKKLRFFVHLSFILSNVIGIGLFLVMVAICVWAKFWALGNFNRGRDGKITAVASSSILLIFLVFIACILCSLKNKLVREKFQRNFAKTNTERPVDNYI
ncbi:Calcium release-activated calcium channel protein 1 [Halotydeus destructor]|nr:Calcium release-activated calcium channel protein 1 [Halotydeus destructor]